MQNVDRWSCEKKNKTKNKSNKIDKIHLNDKIDNNIFRIFIIINKELNEKYLYKKWHKFFWSNLASDVCIYWIACIYTICVDSN